MNCFVNEFAFCLCVVAGLFWKENKAVAAAASNGNDAKGAAKKGSIKEAFDIVRGDQKLMRLDGSHQHQLSISSGAIRS